MPDIGSRGKCQVIPMYLLIPLSCLFQLFGKLPAGLSFWLRATECTMYCLTYCIILSISFYSRACSSLRGESALECPSFLILRVRRFPGEVLSLPREPGLHLPVSGLIQERNKTYFTFQLFLNTHPLTNMSFILGKHSFFLDPLWCCTNKSLLNLNILRNILPVCLSFPHSHPSVFISPNPLCCCLLFKIVTHQHINRSEMNFNEPVKTCLFFPLTAEYWVNVIFLHPGGYA